MQSPEPLPEVVPIGKLQFASYNIPAYQRPYKWGVENVNRLINDLIAFKGKAKYRLGTLVLHNGDIVDGQQRIVTLTLLLKSMFERLTDAKKLAYYHPIIESIDKFAANCKFTNPYSLYNIVENTRIIEAREDDLNDSLLDFILSKCEFVVISLTDISEAFQFFDSQNARGKDLEAHDLLKAYHLREIPTLSDDDARHIDFWQQIPTSRLRHLFLTLFRAKRWSQGKSARQFTKDNTHVFKGISLSNPKRYPFYRMEIIAHIFTETYRNDPLRQIDRNTLEYPHNLDDQIVNGSRFFDMVHHYKNLYDSIHNLHETLHDGIAREILLTIKSYNGAERTGDRYVREMFDTALLYYIDRFGIDEDIHKVIPKIFIWAYSLRLDNYAVKPASIDNHASAGNSMLRRIHHADTPYDIINIHQSSLESVSCSRCNEIRNLFKRLKKLKNDL